MDSSPTKTQTLAIGMGDTGIDIDSAFYVRFAAFTLLRLATTLRNGSDSDAY